MLSQGLTDGSTAPQNSNVPAPPPGPGPGVGTTDTTAGGPLPIGHPPDPKTTTTTKDTKDVPPPDPKTTTTTKDTKAVPPATTTSETTTAKTAKNTGGAAATTIPISIVESANVIEVDVANPPRAKLPGAPLDKVTGARPDLLQIIDQQPGVEQDAIHNETLAARDARRVIVRYSIPLSIVSLLTFDTDVSQRLLRILAKTVSTMGVRNLISLCGSLAPRKCATTGSQSTTKLHICK